MSSLIATIKLREAVSKAAIEGHVFDGLDQVHLSDWENKWAPIVQATIRKMRTQGVPPPQSAHWDWNKKAAAFHGFLARRMFAVTCAGETQGLMAVSSGLVSHTSRIPDDQGRIGLGLVYIDFLEAAPWNRPEHVATPRYRGVGSVLVATAIQLSLDDDLKGRIGLHALPQSEDFYRSVLRMRDLGPDLTYPGLHPLRYFEFTAAEAQAFTSGGNK